MAADDKSPEGGADADQTATGKNNAPARDAKKERAKTLDTQSLRALAPSNEVARSALEMRQNLEKYMPPGEQRDQLIAQLKEDVTPILSPELEAKKVEQGKSAEQVMDDREKSLNEAIDRAAELIRGKLGQFENFGPVKEVASVADAVVDHLRQVLHEPRRGKGEFQIAVCSKDGKHFSTSRYFEPSTTETFAYERQTTEGLADLQISGYQIEAVIHSHQETEGIDATHFLNADVEQADRLQTEHGEASVRCYLLTPAPENIVIVYSPNYKEKLPLGETVGVFIENGNFEVRNDKYQEAFQNTNLIAGS